METSGPGDIKGWVVSYGKGARVPEPETLRKQLMDDLPLPMIGMHDH